MSNLPVGTQTMPGWGEAASGAGKSHCNLPVDWAVNLTGALLVPKGELKAYQPMAIANAKTPLPNNPY